MKKTLVVGLIGLSAGPVFAAADKVQPLDAKPGLWQTTMTPKNGATMTYKNCLKAEDLASGKWANNFKCSTWRVLNCTGTDIEVEGRGCNMGHGMTADLHMKFHFPDSQHGTRAKRRGRLVAVVRDQA